MVFFNLHNMFGNLLQEVSAYNFSGVDCKQPFGKLGAAPLPQHQSGVIALSVLLNKIRHVSSVSSPVGHVCQ